MQDRIIWEDLTGERVEEPAAEAWEYVRVTYPHMLKHDPDITLEDTLNYTARCKALIEANYLQFHPNRV